MARAPAYTAGCRLPPQFATGVRVQRSLLLAITLADCVRGPCPVVRGETEEVLTACQCKRCGPVDWLAACGTQCGLRTAHQPEVAMRSRMGNTKNGAHDAK